jgi:hypothetical protein
MTGYVWLALAVAALLLAAYGSKRSSRKAIGGLMGKDKKGRTTLVIWPAPKKRKAKGRRK